MLGLEEEKNKVSYFGVPAHLVWSFIAWLLLETEVKEV